jgi:hypothetical protein
MPQSPMKMKLFFPDACWRQDIISGALFLYFRKEMISLSLHPSVSTFTTGIDPFDFFTFAENRAPKWLPKLSTFGGLWNQYRTSLQQTSTILEPLRGDGFKTIMFSYNRGKHGWEAAEDLIASSNLPFAEITKLIDPFSAADELFSHIFFEKFLELYEGHRTQEELVALGAERAQSKDWQPRLVDWRPLYEYVDRLFGSKDLDEILTITYMFRLPILKAIPAVLLSNPNMLSFLASLPVETKRPDGDSEKLIDLDVIGWEFFRQLLSSKVDPLNDKSVATLRNLIKEHPAEIDALARKCLSLAQELSDETNLETLQSHIGQHIRANVEGEIESLLFVNKAAVNEFLDSVFADDKAWIGIGTLLYSLVQGGPTLTAGAAIATLARVGSKAMKAAAERRKKLETSDYTLLYRMRS